ncbi:MAG: excinuclease ABC subunit UvrA [Granulosicoccus sp.]|nr:excinuclease ABC subunit UvrA [Granulosicoccus sp.]
MNPIHIRQARLHNLKSFDLTIPQDKLVVVSGVSGSGKSTLVFDILFEESRKRYLHAIGAFPELNENPGFDEITGLRPAIAVKQGTIRRSNPRSVVGSRTRLLHHLGALFAHEHNRKLAPHDAVPTSLFSFNSPNGMCLDCTGRGYKFHLNMDVLLPEPTTSLLQMYKNCGMETSFRKFTERLVRRFGIDPAAPFSSYSTDIQNFVLYGLDPEGPQLTGLHENLKARLLHGKDIANAMTATACVSCKGFKLNPTALNIKIGKKHLGDLARMTIAELSCFIQSLSNSTGKDKTRNTTQKQILRQIDARLHLLKLVRLDHLSLYRPLPTLSGGEAQRLSLMSFLGSDLESVLYIFDEPTTGLHEIEKSRLLKQISSLQDNNNAVIIVEHDPYTLSLADHIIDVGPEAGIQGGSVVFEGSYAKLLKAKDSVTGRFLARQSENGYRPKATGRSTARSTTRAKADSIKLTHVQTNNLQGIDVAIPLGCLVGVAGVSGSGKSSLIADTLVPIIRNHLADEASVDSDISPELNIVKTPPRVRRVSGLKKIQRCIEINQQPIGRRKGSNPATYLGLWDRIRRCFASQPLARERGYNAGYFSFNSAGACEQCNGNGSVQMWLGITHVHYPCDACQGQRYKPEVLDVTYKSHSIAEVLALSSENALALFASEQSIARMLTILVTTGMGYMTLGQPTTTLSGGEAQRLKLAKELGRQTGNQGTLFVLDEPTAGLSLYDTEKLLGLLEEILDSGCSVIVIEHDPAVLSRCDWIIELGPEGGNNGGRIIAEGSAEAIRKNPASVIKSYLS